MRKLGMFLVIGIFPVFFFPLLPLAAQNLATNGSFEVDTAGTPIPNNGGGDSGSGWRFFAVGGADGSATISSAAATDGAVGVELTRVSTGVGDSALDKDTANAREIIPKTERVYKVLVDVKDGGTYGGSPSFAVGAQFLTGSMNRGKGFDPSGAFETIGLSALSDNLGSLSIRMDIPDGNHSVLLDNVRLFDTTYNSNRVINSGFENSATRLLNWRFYSLNPGELLVTLDSDAHSGSRAARIERTNDFDTNDGALDLWDDRVGVLPGEIINYSYWVKKVSGDEFMRVGTKVVQFNAAGDVLTENYWFSSDPSETAYRRFNHTVGMTADTRYISINFMVSNSSGSDRYLGAYLVDDVSISHAENILSNPSFEEFADEESLASGAYSKGWRFFAVGGAMGSATARAAAATDGSVGIELVRETAEGGDSALDRDIPGLARVRMPADDRPYSMLVDVKDGGLYEGTDIFHLDSQFLDGTGTSNSGHTFDPGDQFETIGVSAGSGTDSQGSVRMDFRNGGANRSAFLDHVRMIDVSRKDRMINGGFENSDSRLLNWRHFSVNPGEVTASLSTDAHSGSNAARVERLAEGEGISDGGIDIDPYRIVLIGGETLTIRYSVKKVSGAEGVRPMLTFAQFDSTGAWLGGAYQYSFTDANPGTGAYETFTYSIITDPAARFANVAVRIIDETGAQRIGAFLVDDVQVIRNQAPSFTEASITPSSPNENDVLSTVTGGWADLDNDGEGYLYQWKKNGNVIPGATNPKLTSLDFAGGDSITCVLTAFDGIETGNSIETTPVLIAPLSVSDWAQY